MCIEHSLLSSQYPQFPLQNMTNKLKKILNTETNFKGSKDGEIEPD